VGLTFTCYFLQFIKTIIACQEFVWMADTAALLTYSPFEFGFFLSVVLAMSALSSSEESPLQKSLTESSIGFYSISIASFAMCTIAVMTIADYFFDCIFVMFESEEKVLSERFMICAMSFVAALFPLCASNGQIKLLPFVYVFVHSIQLCGFAFAFLRVFNREYSKFFTSVRTFWIRTFAYLSCIAPMAGFGKGADHWLNIASVACVLGHACLYYLTLWKLLAEGSILSKKFNDYSLNEVHSSCYLLFYSIYQVIIIITRLCFYCTWSKFNLWGINVLSFSTFVFAVLVFTTPSKLTARIRMNRIAEKNAFLAMRREHAE